MSYETAGVAIVLISIFAGAIWLRKRRGQEKLYAALFAAALLLCMMALKMDSIPLLAGGVAILLYALWRWRLVTCRKHL